MCPFFTYLYVFQFVAQIYSPEALVSLWLKMMANLDRDSIS